jgi:ABC-type uncharacterized transport system auxiliary subunit
MKHWKRACLLLPVLAFVMAAGCMKLNQHPIKIEYYTLEYEPVRLAESPTLPYVIAFERFTSAPLYNTTRIIFREKPFSRDAYNYHKWRAVPADLVSYFIARDMGRSGLFEAALPPGMNTGSTHVVSGSVDEFYERDLPDRWEAVMAVTVNLELEGEPNPAKRLVFQKTYSSVQKCADKTPGSVAEAMSLAMAEISRSVISDIYTALSSTKQHPS